jgi:predicted phosphodiesterase
MSSNCIAIIADIHGTLPSLKAVLADIQSNSPDEIIVAGDFIVGPQPREVMNLLQGLGCKFILGNGELNMIKMHQGTAPKEWWTHRQFDLGRWIFDSLDEDIFELLLELPEQLVVQPSVCPPVRVLHGAPWDIYAEIFPHEAPEVLERALMMIPEDVMVFAHTHLPDVIYLGKKLAVNPGSVSNNFNGDPRASYATLSFDPTGWQPRLHFVSYDLSEVVRVYKETGFLQANDPLSRAFLESVLTGENVGRDFIRHAFQQARDAGYVNIKAVPDEIWIGAAETFPWQFAF